jgi:catechol-2,3-dioxygenase
VSGSQGSGGSAKRSVKRPALHHVNFKTTRLQEMIDWYANTVGIEVMFQNEAVAFTSNDANGIPSHRRQLKSS